MLDCEPLGAGGWDDRPKYTPKHHVEKTLNTRTHLDSLRATATKELITRTMSTERIQYASVTVLRVAPKAHDN